LFFSLIFIVSLFPPSSFLLSYLNISYCIWHIFKKCSTHEQYAFRQENVSWNRRCIKRSMYFWVWYVLGGCVVLYCAVIGCDRMGGRCGRGPGFDSHQLTCAFLFSHFHLFVVFIVFSFILSSYHPIIFEYSYFIFHISHFRFQIFKKCGTHE
jgi:hypothetical protein